MIGLINPYLYPGGQFQGPPPGAVRAGKSRLLQQWSVPEVSFAQPLEQTGPANATKGREALIRKVLAVMAVAAVAGVVGCWPYCPWLRNRWPVPRGSSIPRR